MAALRAHPGFQAAMREIVQSMLAVYSGNRLINALMNDRARALFTQVALYLHFAGRADGRPGLTISAMKDMCAEAGLCSRGRCEAILTLMRAAGFFAAAPHDDKRRRPLVPTDKLIALQRTRWVEHFRAMRHVIPEANDYLAALDNPDFVGRFACQLGTGWAAGVRVLAHSPGLEVLTERNAGMIILFSLCFAGREDGPFPPVEPVPLSINALATSFGVSRKHVLTLIRDSETAGLLSRGGAANDEVAILPRAREGLAAFFAAMFVYEAQCAARALRDVAPAPVEIRVEPA